MKSGCEFEHLFEGYFRSDLSPAEELTLLKHLETCPSCPQKLDDYYRLHNELLKYKRPPTNSDLINSYYQQVDLSYGRETISQKLTLALSRLSGKRTPLSRIVQFSTLILIGIVVGWLFFAPVEPKVVFHSSNPYETSQPISLKDIDYIHAYLQVAQMILYQIENDPEFYLERELAQNLLIKTYRVTKLSLQLNNLRMINFMNRMELLLHEASNLDEEDKEHSLAQIKRLIDEANLLREVKDLESMLEITKEEFGT